MTLFTPNKRLRAPQQRAELTKSRLLDAATKAFALAGFKATPALALEKAAKVKRGLLVYHFGSKEGLWRAVADRLAARVEASMLRVAESDNGKSDPVELVVRAFIIANTETPEFLRMTMIESQRGPSPVDYTIDIYIRRFIAGVELMTGRTMTVHDYYALLGACSFFFMSPREAIHIWGVDPASEEFIAGHTKVIADMLRPLWRVERPTDAPIGTAI
ncbi:MAG: TetR/AcrR family transcriptional regulator [Proteobacteria bacterium]|nr:TetR/AcrR family transcriptional regulator [Pseudomonadota bacterium]